MRILSWNVNGIRACEKKGFGKWLESQSADVVCIQESKARPDQLGEEHLHPAGYASHWHSAEKAGYSGVAIYSKKEPTDLQMGMGIPRFDSEGRVITAEFGDLLLINAYFPNSQREHARLEYKLDFCDAIFGFCEKNRNRGKHVILTGDYNIAHKAIDLRNPKENENNAGYLPEERAWMDRFLGAGYVDTFRKFEPGPGHYTWWSYRPGVRERNIGWRIDYFTVNPEMEDRLQVSRHHAQVMGSDHCPIELKIL